MITQNLQTLKIHKLTQEQYDRELAAGNIDPNAIYLTPDEAADLSKYATVEQLNTKANAEHEHSDLDAEISALNTLVGDEAVASQISKAVENVAIKWVNF